MDSMALTGEGETVGTPAYMSPELLLGQEPTVASDLYSLGIMFYRMLTGYLPFRSRSPVVMMHHHIDSRPPDLPASMSDLNPVIQRLLAKKPADRFQSAHELHQALSEFI